MPLATMAEQDEYIEQHCQDTVAFIERVYRLDHQAALSVLRIGFGLGWNACWLKEREESSANHQLPAG